MSVQLSETLKQSGVVFSLLPRFPRQWFSTSIRIINTEQIKEDILKVKLVALVTRTIMIIIWVPAEPKELSWWYLLVWLWNTAAKFLKASWCGGSLFLAKQLTLQNQCTLLLWGKFPLTATVLPVYNLQAFLTILNCLTSICEHVIYSKLKMAISLILEYTVNNLSNLVAFNISLIKVLTLQWKHIPSLILNTLHETWLTKSCVTFKRTIASAQQLSSSLQTLHVWVSPGSSHRLSLWAVWH